MKGRVFEGAGDQVGTAWCRRQGDAGDIDVRSDMRASRNKDRKNGVCFSN